MEKLVVSAIVVTHNSEKVIEQCLASIAAQQGCTVKIIVVDSGSNDTLYLRSVQKQYPFELICLDNIGFSQANNSGYQKILPESQLVSFINPDVILPPDYLLNSWIHLERDKEVAVISGLLLGYDFQAKKMSGRIDSTGIFRSWYGRWYDRDIGKEIASVNRRREYVPAICGALMVCRKSALKDFGERVFDPDFFLYKEDIELSLRLRKKGWRLLFEPGLVAYHGRGWNTRRSEVTRELRLTASQSEILLYQKHPSPYLGWALLKYCLVRLFGI